MRKTALGLTLASAFGIACYVIAQESTTQPASHAGGCAGKADKGACSKSQMTAQVAEELAKLPSVQRADAAMKSWAEVPTRLASMTDADKAELQAAMAKAQQSHPAGALVRPTMQYLHNTLATLAQVDRAAAKLCSAEAKPESDGHTCPTKAAAVAAAKLEMQKSSALSAKANELMLAAYKAGGSCGDKGGCTKGEKTASATDGCASGKATLASATEEKKGGCTKGEKASLAAGEEKSGGCASGKASLTAVTEEKKGGCAKGEKAALTAGAEEKGSCSKSEHASLASGTEEKKGGCTKGEKASLAAGEEKSGGCASGKASLTAGTEEKKGGCTKGEKASLASGEEKSGSCASGKASLTAGTAEKKGGCAKGEKASLASGTEAGKEGCCKKDGGASGCCKEKGAVAEADPKAIAAKAHGLISESGALLAKWTAANVALAGMSDADRLVARQAAANASSRCPLGSRMPETLGAIGDLLRDAATMEAHARAACQKQGMCKEIPAELRELAETRSMLLNAALNVVEKTQTVMKPAQQVASAQ